MKKFWVLLLCLLLAGQAAAVPLETTDASDREALLAGLFEADIATARRAIDLRLISCTELTEYYLERIEEYNDTFHCFITLCDNALEVAQQRDADLAAGRGRGALFGIPVVVKDNIRYEGYPATNGLKMNSGPVDESAVVVQHLLREGAVILGKTNMSAGAQDAYRSVNAAGMETFNAYDPCLAAGGSSGGSAVAVSLNFAMAGLGTDTNSSLRYPAALNGCVSMRPTTGLIDREGCIILNHKKDTPGAITRSVRDQALMLDVLTGGENNYVKNLNPDAIKGMRIGVLAELSYPTPGVYDRKKDSLDPEICQAFDRAVSELKTCGAEIVTVSMPEIFRLKTVAAQGNNRARESYYEKLQELMEENQVQLLVYPTYLHPPHYRDKEHLAGKDAYKQLYISNCSFVSPQTGAPEISVPIGVHSRGAGIGMEFFAQKNEEQLLLDVACGYTDQFDHRVAPATAPELHAGDKKLSQLLEEWQEERQEKHSGEKEILPSETTAETEPPSETETAPEEQKLPEEIRPERDQSWIFYAVLFAGVAVLMGVMLYRDKKYRT